MPKPDDGRAPPPEITNGVLAAVVAWIRFVNLEVINLYLTRNWPQSLLGVSEPRWRPIEVRDTDNVVRLDRRQRLVRWDRRPPNEIFLNGFVPIVTNENPDWSQTDLYNFAKSNVPSIFVSTTKTQFKKNGKYVWTPRSANRGIVYQYEIYAPGGLDVNESLSEQSPWPNQMEVAFPGGIQNVYIRSARELHDGRVQRIWINPNFLDPNELAPIACSSRTPQVMWRENHPDGGNKDSGRAQISPDELMYGGDGDVVEDPFDNETDNAQPFPNGQFMIESVLNDNYFLDLAQNKQGGIVHSHAYNGAWLNQRWEFIYDSSKKAYKIKSKLNANLLLSWDSNANPKEMILRGYTVSGSNNQYWRIEHVNDECYRLRNLENLNMIVTVQNNFNLLGGKEVLVESGISTSGKDNNQKWRMRPVSFQVIPDGNYRIFNCKLPDIVVDYSNQNDHLIHGHSFLDSNSQEWRFTYDDKKESYKIISGLNSSLFLSWDSNANPKEVILRAYTNSGSNNQYWRIEQNEDGSYKLRNMADLSLIMQLDYQKNSPHGGLNLIVHNDSKDYPNLYPNWKIVLVSYKCIPDGNYNIFNRHMPNIVIDSSNQKDALIHGHAYCANNNQKWSFVYDENKKAYKIKSGINSALWLSWDSNAASKEILLRAYTESGSLNQYWRIELTNDGSYKLRNLLNLEKIIAVVNKNSPYGGKELIVSDSNEGWSNWYLNRIGEVVIPDGKYRIATKVNYKKVIDYNRDRNLVIMDNINLASSEWEIKYDSTKKAYNIYSGQYFNIGWIYQNKNFYVKVDNIDGTDHGDSRYFWIIEYSIQYGCYMIRSLYDPSHAVGYSNNNFVVTDTSTYSDNQLFHFIPI
uniref:Pierisin n=1 Tax=Aporia crataegi TaxID=129397 RepID=C6L2F6_APOCT|nr:pierisin-4 [Aporia crataegi]